MVRSLNASLLVATTIALLVSFVASHGHLKNPVPTFVSSDLTSTYPSTIEGSSVGASLMSIPTEEKGAAVVVLIKKTGAKSLKDFIIAKQVVRGNRAKWTPACGYSDPNGTPQDLPEKLEWISGRDVRVLSHPGPCEAWCDDEVVVPLTDDCHTAFRGGDVPFAKDMCDGKKQLSFYWLAVHQPAWQVFMNCVPLKGSTNGGASGMDADASAPGAGAGGNTTAPSTTSRPVTPQPTPSKATTGCKVRARTATLS